MGATEVREQHVMDEFVHDRAVTHGVAQRGNERKKGTTGGGACPGAAHAHPGRVGMDGAIGGGRTTADFPAAAAAGGGGDEDGDGNPKHPVSIPRTGRSGTVRRS